MRPQPGERRAGDQGVDDAVERVRHRESRALAPPDPVLPVSNDVAAEGDGTTHQPGSSPERMILEFCRKITRSGDAEMGMAGETVVGSQLLSTSRGYLQ